MYCYYRSVYPPKKGHSFQTVTEISCGSSTVHTKELPFGCFFSSLRAPMLCNSYNQQIGMN